MLSMLFMTAIPRIIRTDFNGSASNLKPTVSATTMILLWNVSVLSMRIKTCDPRYWFEGLFRIWNQRFLQQPFSYRETSQCCQRQSKPRIVGTDLKRSASLLKPTVSQQPFSDGETSQCCSWQPEHRIISADLKKSVTIPKPTVSAATIFLL